MAFTIAREIFHNIMAWCLILYMFASIFDSVYAERNRYPWSVSNDSIETNDLVLNFKQVVKLKKLNFVPKMFVTTMDLNDEGLVALYMRGEFAEDVLVVIDSNGEFIFGYSMDLSRAFKHSVGLMWGDSNLDVVFYLENLVVRFDKSGSIIDAFIIDEHNNEETLRDCEYRVSAQKGLYACELSDGFGVFYYLFGNGYSRVYLSKGNEIKCIYDIATDRNIIVFVRFGLLIGIIAFFIRIMLSAIHRTNHSKGNTAQTS